MVLVKQGRWEQPPGLQGPARVGRPTLIPSRRGCRTATAGFVLAKLEAVPTELLKMGSDHNSVSGGIPPWIWIGSCYTNKYGFPDDVPGSFGSTPHPRLRRSGEPVNQYKKLLCERVRIPGRCSRSPSSASSENRILLSLASACSLAPFIFPSWAVFFNENIMISS